MNYDQINADLTALRGKRAQLLNTMASLQGRATAILDKATAADRELTAPEIREEASLRSRFNEIETQVKAVDAEIEALESTPMPRASSPTPIAGTMPGERMAPAPAALTIASPRSFSAMFNGRRAPDPYAGRFSSLGEFAAAVASGTDERLLRNATMTTSVGTEGGFAVPLQFLGPILDAALQMEVIRPRANVIPMTSKSATAGVFDYQDGTSAKRAGLQMLWGAEAATLTEQKGKLREVSLRANKGAIFCRLSSELASDAPGFDAQLGRAMVAAVASGLDYAFLNGTGAGQPLGILAANNLVTVSKEAGQAASTILFQNLVKMVGRLSPASFSSAIWMVHPTCVPQLYTMAYVTKNVAGTENVSGAAAAAITVDGSGQLRIFGRPAVVTDACSALSAKGDVILADLSKYIVGLRADATIKRDESRYFDSDEIAFRLTIRVDGQPEHSDAQTLRDGSNTVSPFVTLEAR